MKSSVLSLQESDSVACSMRRGAVLLEHCKWLSAAKKLDMVCCDFEHRIFNIINLINNLYKAPSIELQTEQSNCNKFQCYITIWNIGV